VKLTWINGGAPIAPKSLQKADSGTKCRTGGVGATLPDATDMQARNGAGAPKGVNHVADAIQPDA
jgi:hypothetical protein